MRKLPGAGEDNHRRRQSRALGRRPRNDGKPVASTWPGTCREREGYQE